jgi:hypothetical protein
LSNPTFLPSDTYIAPTFSSFFVVPGVSNSLWTRFIFANVTLNRASDDECSLQCDIDALCIIMFRIGYICHFGDPGQEDDSNKFTPGGGTTSWVMFAQFG